MSSNLQIGLMGLNFGSANLGCSALAISFYLGIVEELKKKNIECTFIAICACPQHSLDYLDKQYPIHFIEYHLSKPFTIINAINGLKKCSIIFDFTEGDSFSDIYGSGRFYRSIVLKLAVERLGIPLVLGPQTYGPFSKKTSQFWSKKIITSATRVYSRDYISISYLQDLGVTKRIISSTDVAFRLPYSKSYEGFNSNKIRIGINISGLLWDNDLYRNNELGLSVHYIEYCKKLIERIKEKCKYSIYLIPHVGLSTNNIESDYHACHTLKNEIDGCCLLDCKKDPILAKSDLAQMDIVIAARMHASIGAFSSGVFTIPFAYSRKFEGYYNRLNYPVLINGIKYSTEEAIEKTMEYIENYEKYQPAICDSQLVANNLLDEFYRDIITLIKN